METAYYEKWWFSRRKPIAPMSVECARQRHEARRSYAAVVGDMERPRHLVDFAEGWVSVIFLDQHLRQYLRYDFKVTDEGKLFLKTATHWEYAGTSEVESARKIFSFEMTGCVVMEEQKAHGEVRELTTVASIDENWVDYPPFGDYRSLCRAERASPYRKASA